VAGKPRQEKIFSNNILDDLRGLKYVVGVRDENIIIEICPPDSVMPKDSKVYKRLTSNNGADKYFIVTRTCKDDIKWILDHHRDKEINKLTNGEMSYIASKLCDDYVEQMYWDSLASIVNDILDDKKEEVEWKVD